MDDAVVCGRHGPPRLPGPFRSRQAGRQSELVLLLLGPPNLKARRRVSQEEVELQVDGAVSVLEGDSDATARTDALPDIWIPESRPRVDLLLTWALRMVPWAKRARWLGLPGCPTPRVFP